MPDTIAAIATPQLPSAIGILRLSGPDTRRILDVVFSPAHGGPVSCLLYTSPSPRDTR